MAEAAARAGDNIHHTSALAGFIVGSLIGAALIAYVAFATFTCGFGAALLAGLCAGIAANSIRSLGEWVGSKCKSTTGKILAPGCSGNVFINGKPAARAVVTSAECEKDMPMSPIAEGSSNVFINQNAAARKDDKIQCGATISEGSDDVVVGGGKVQYLAVKDEVPDWVRKASEILFTVASIAGGAAGAFKQVGGVLNKCALKFVGGYVAGEVIGSYVSEKAMGFLGGLFGNPVDVTNGQKILFDGQELDFVTSARLPLFWQRYYSSELGEGILGQGWRLDFEVSLSLDDDRIIYCGRTGQQTYFPRLGVGEYSYSAESQLHLYCMTDGRHVIRTLDDIYTVFPAFDNNATVYLDHIEDIDRNFIRFHYDDTAPARLLGISDSQNNTLICHWHPYLARLLFVERLNENGTKEELVRYSYDEQGYLLAVYNPAGKLTRSFAYDSHGLMTAHTNALGMQCFYHWQQKDEDKWYVDESHNSEGERSQYRYDFANRTTCVEDERGLEARWEFNAREQVTLFEDFNRDIYRISYNEHGMPIEFHLPGERRIVLERDSLNRIINEVDPLGRAIHTDYYLNTLNVVRKTFPDGGVWHAEYDEKGHMLAATDPLGFKTHYAYDERGLPVQIIDAAGGKKELVWNKRAQLQQYTDCSGKSVYYEWNEYGDLISTANMLGETTRFNYNAQHELQVIHYPDGAEERFSYFSAGLLKYHTDTAGRRREWYYNRRGQPLQYTDRLNRKLHYFYDTKGNLNRLLNANGGEYRFSYDTIGRLVEEQRPDKTSHRLRYDAAGLPVLLRWLGNEHSERTPQFREIYYHYDKGNRLIERHTQMAEFFYHYDAADRLLELRRQPTEWGEENGIDADMLAFSWDKNGQLLNETHDGEALDYQWDALGNLTNLRLPDNNTLHWLSYGSGHISAIRFNQNVVTEFERDDLHREVLRTQGALTQRRGYDVRGRRRWQSAFIATVSGLDTTRPEQGKLWRTFRFDQAGELGYTADAFRGEQHYLYDAESRLLEYSVAQPEGGKERFSYDDADNIYGVPDLDWESIHGGKPEAFRSNRLPFWHHIGFVYDGFGNLTQRTQGSLTQHFAYDDENHLIRAWGDGPKGRYEAHYKYDALGRRTSKSVTYQGQIEAITTHFRWQGMRLVQETNAEYTRSYIYDPNEVYTPLARVTYQGDNSQIEYFHTDLNGMPLDVTDSAGNIIWCGRYSAWGKLKPQVHLTEEIPGLPYQPLRYPGQYYDDESGLHYNTFRYYDPEVGRFTTQDPIGLLGGLNLYQYGPNAISWIDPLGWDKHHIIPQQLWKEFKGSLKEVSGYVQNVSKKAMNGVNLMDLDTPFHGNHPAYTDFVRGRLSALFGADGKNKVSLDDIKDLSRSLKSEINNALKEFNEGSGNNLNDYFKSKGAEGSGGGSGGSGKAC